MTASDTLQHNTKIIKQQFMQNMLAQVNQNLKCKTEQAGKLKICTTLLSFSELQKTSERKISNSFQK